MNTKLVTRGKNGWIGFEKNEKRPNDFGGENA